MRGSRARCWGAAGLLVAALLLPLVEHGDGEFSGRWVAYTLIPVTVVALAIACRQGGSTAIVATLLVSTVLCLTTSALLNVPKLAGNAGLGFWAIVAAAWIAAAEAVVGLATLKLRTATSRRLVDLAVPLLFGMFLFYLWESWSADLASRLC